ncbi:PAS domain S-box protein, partial [Kitasatospora sp. NPDC001574]
MVALVRLALVLVDRSGRITQWSRAAEELFGHRAEVVHDRPATGLLPAAEPRSVPAPAGAGIPPARRRDAFDTLAELTATGTAWAGQLPVVDREGRLRDVLWWAYPVDAVAVAVRLERAGGVGGGGAGVAAEHLGRP